MADEQQHYIYNMSGYQWPDKFSEIKDGYTTNPIVYTDNPDTEPGQDVTVTAGDYVKDGEYQFKSSADKDPVVPSCINHPLYVYTLNSEWKYAGTDAYESSLYGHMGCSIFDGSGTNIALDEGDGSFYVGSTCDKIVVSPYNKEGITSYYVEDYDGTGGYKYYGNYPSDWDIESPTLIEHTETQKVTANYGDFVIAEDNIGGGFSWFKFQYPGVWVAANQYPDLTVQIPEQKYKGHVQLKWTDPQDITDWKPTPATWEGTVIVRKENSAPLHRWDGDKVVRTTTRDKYKSKPYKDEDIETNKVYYYAFMPYYTKIDDPQHPIRYYTFTKCIRVETGTISYIPEIIKIDMNEDVATITYAITLPATGPYDTAKLYGKKDGNPACDNTDDIVEDISQVDDQIVVPDIDGDYYFCIQVANGTDTLTSDVVGCYGEHASVVPEEYWDIIDDITHFYYDKPTEIYDYQYTNIGDSGQSYWNHPKGNSYYNNNAKDATQAQWFNQDNFVTAFSELDINITYSSATNKYLLGFTSGAYNDAIYYFGGVQKFYSSAYLGVDGDKVAFLGKYNYNVSLPTSQVFTSLASALGYLRTHFRRCGVYVEGVQWGVRDTGHL